ncbi:MAG: transglutaminase family protein [Mangrovibacterium sp.]
MSYILLKSVILGSFFVLIGCRQVNQKGSLQSVENKVEEGQFYQAGQLIDSLRQVRKNDAQGVAKLDSLQDMMRRILLDFSKDEKQVKSELSRYGLSDDSLMRQWEKSGKLEMRIIDGQRRYFSNAVPNLFRLDSKANLRKLQTDGIQIDSLGLFRLKHTADIIQASDELFHPVLPVSMTLTYTVKVKSNVVPEGKLISCWMPVPREGNPRQKKFTLLETIPDSSILAPGAALQRTIFLQKRAVSNESTVFQIRFAVETAAQYFDLSTEKIKPYVTESEQYREFTAERPPQIMFTRQIRKLAERIVGDETNPLRKAEKIYRWISDTIPWTSALEYCTMNQIPGYVIENGHGDCGMQTLLFMSLVRSQGIPAKWQSGWMLHPGHVNLHDWCEVYYEGIGWVPVDQSFKLQDSDDKRVREFYMHGIDSYRLIVNDDYGRELYPPKKFPRSEPYDFQRGELEWEGGNLYFDQWSWDMKVEYHMETGNRRTENGDRNKEGRSR